MLTSIITARLVLRAPAADDLASYLAYRNDPSSLVSQFLPAVDADSALTFLDAQSRREERACGWRMLAVEFREEPGIVGEVGVFISAECSNEGDLGWWLHPTHHGRGFATEAVKALICWCFSERKLHRVTARCLSANDASRRLMNRVGMRLEVQAIESRWLAGRWHDELGYALLRREWVASGPKPVSDRDRIARPLGA
ncbi:GNAT family N-acetyltransferase [uncultured Enterovirga sp.]|uniref:GNAT family N-acetyltransferase n=1 Tax=uncultured Enterovirga sp. TaxID=2026352 RepID=UPI0035CC9695